MSSGYLDTTFNRPDGYVSKKFFNANTERTSLALDSSGNIYVTGSTYADSSDPYMFLAKYNKSGVLASGFGDNGSGYVIKQFLGGETRGYDVSLDSSGNIYVTGYTTDADFTIGNFMFLAKYNTSGVLASGFGDNGSGYVLKQFNDKSSFGFSLQLDSSGNIYVTGNTHNTGAADFMFLAKYNTSGVLASGFGDNGSGYVTKQFFSGYSSPVNSVILDKIGNIYVTSTSVNKSGDYSGYMVLAKYTSSGVLDKNFANGTGYASKSLSYVGIYQDNSAKYTSTIDSSGNIYVTGVIRTNDTGDKFTYFLFLAKYTQAGVLDLNFGGNGSGSISKQFYGGYNSYGTSIVLDSTGSIYVTGSVNISDFSFNTLVAKYTNNGILDTSFGDGTGYITEMFISNSNSVGNSIALDSSGNIFVTGDLDNSMLLAKFLNSNTTTTSTTHYEPICLVRGTPILTDQGLVPIELIDTNKHTISNKPIIAITKSITPDNYLVGFEKNSIAINYPTQRTIMTPGHCVLYKGNMVPAKEFIGNVNGVHKIPYNGKDVLYNVLMNGYYLMNVNGMTLETLHPKNKVAKKILSGL